MGLALLAFILAWIGIPVVMMIFIRWWRKSPPFSERISHILTWVYVPLFLFALIEIYLIFWTPYSLRGFWIDFIPLAGVFSLAVLLAAKSQWRSAAFAGSFLSVPIVLLSLYLPLYFINQAGTDILYSDSKLRIESGNGIGIQMAGYRLILKGHVFEWEKNYSANTYDYYNYDCKIKSAEIKGDGVILRFYDCQGPGSDLPSEPEMLLGIPFYFED